MQDEYRCEFVPEDPLNRQRNDTRIFRRGERVCMNGANNPRMGVYHGTVRNYSHLIESPEYPGYDRFVPWYQIGKMIPTKGNKFATYSLLRQKNVPADAGELISNLAGLHDPSRYRRDDYANVPAPHGVSANRLGGRSRKSKRRVRKTRRRHK